VCGTLKYFKQPDISLNFHGRKQECCSLPSEILISVTVGGITKFITNYTSAYCKLLEKKHGVITKV
jgi:hypothetical protein